MRKTTAFLVGIGLLFAASPLLVSAQTVNASGGVSIGDQQLIAVLTQLVQLLEQELAQLTSSASGAPSSQAGNSSFGSNGTGISNVMPNFQMPVQPTPIQLPCIAGIGSTLWNGSGTSNCGTTTTSAGAPFSASPTYGQAPLSVQFTSTGPSGSDIGQTVNFGDGTTGTLNPAPVCATCNLLATVGHTYQNAGTYTATLANSSGATLGTATITVTPQAACPGGCPLGRSALMVSPTSGQAPLSTTFTTWGLTTGTSYSLNFGDGTSVYAFTGYTLGTPVIPHTYMNFAP
jgi:PKD repeat protein